MYAACVCFRRVQIILWSCIGGTIVAVVAMWLYCKSDNYVCKGPILYKYVLCWLCINAVL